MEWTKCCAGSGVFTLYRDHKVTRTAFMGTITELISSESGLPMEWTRQTFDNPATAFAYLDSMGV